MDFHLKSVLYHSDKFNWVFEWAMKKPDSMISACGCCWLVLIEYVKWDPVFSFHGKKKRHFSLFPHACTSIPKLAIFRWHEK